MQVIFNSTLIYFIFALVTLNFATENHADYLKELVKHAVNYKSYINQIGDLKYILLWTTDSMPLFPPFKFFGLGQRVFIRNNCSYTNCYIKRNRKKFNGHLHHFSAILFNTYHLHFMDVSQLPKIRYPHQKYVFVSQESNDMLPLCNRFYHNFFNWTQTFRLDSDIPLPYIGVKDNNGKVLGPRIGMEWLKIYGSVDERVLLKLKRKTKPVAWFVSHCNSGSNRDDFVNALQKELSHHGMAVDIYGKCGRLKCQHYIHDTEHVLESKCDEILENDYFFYLSLENSIAKDYITEKALRPLLHYTVPIVYGGAEYSRFLPPGSYIDALNQTIEELALIIRKNVNSIEDYKQFFTWRNAYTIYDPRTSDNVCALCAALNNKTKFEMTSTYQDFRKWWDPQFKRRCQLGRVLR